MAKKKTKSKPVPQANDFSDHADTLIAIQKTQDSERNRRDKVKEAKRFLTDTDGMWDQDAVRKLDGRFRGTFDLCSGIIDGISGEIDQADFTLRVSPSGGEASQDTAKTLDGIIRNIRNISNAEDIFNKAGRSNVVGGFDAWEVVQDWIDGDSFDQDLFIRKIPNASDSVWFDMASVEQNRSDAKWCVKLVAVPIDDYEVRWPKGGKVSIGDNSRTHGHQHNEKEVVTVGQLYYRKVEEINLVRMTDGSVYRDDEKFKKTKNELRKQGIKIELDSKGEEKRRTRESWRFYSRMLDGGDWLAPEEKTVFDFPPIIPIYGNFDIIDNETVYFGKLKNLFDPQRALNYGMSRDIEDGALSPAETTWMTDTQASGNDYSRMNTDHVPIRIYNTDDKAKTPPFKTPGAQGSVGLQTTIGNMQEMITASSNTFNAQQGNASSTQSGIAGLQQIEQGNIGSLKWFKSLEVAICQTGKLLVNAIPRVYDGTRQARILEEDGTSKFVPVNKTVFDEESKENIVLNDLTVGEYDVVCEMGPAFNSAQKEAARSFETMAGVAPEFVARGLDIWLKNKKEPGMDLMAERVREDLFNQNLIPESQMTDDEKQKVAEAQALAAQQPPQPDPVALAAQGALLEGQAALQNSQNKTTEIQGNQQISVEKLRLEGQELLIRDKQVDLDTQKFLLEKEDKLNVAAAKLQQGDRKLDQSEQKMIIDADQQDRKIALDEQQAQISNILAVQEQRDKEFTSAVDNLNKLATTMQTIVGPHLLEATVNQAVEVTELQEEQGDTDIGKEVAGTEDE